MAKVKSKTVKSNFRSRNPILLIFILAFGVLGMWFLISSQAATSNFEAESAVLSGGAVTVSDSTASGGKFAQFASSPTSQEKIQRFPGDPNPRVTGKTYWGANVFALLPDGSKTSDVYNRHEKPAGTSLSLHHRYYSWSALDGSSILNNAKADQAANRLPYITFKTADDWGAMGNGTYDAKLDKIIRELDSTGKPVWITLWHEPENDTNGTTKTAAKWVSMQKRFRQRMNAANNGTGTKNIAFMPHFMGGTTRADSSATYDIDQWWVDGIWDVVMFSNYCQRSCVDGGGNTFDMGERKNSIKFLESKGIPWGVGEWSLSERTTGDLKFTKYFQPYFEQGFVGNYDAVAFSYFDADESRPDSSSPYYASLRDANLDEFHRIMRDPRVMRLNDLSTGTTPRYGTMTGSVSIPTTGTYKLWVRMSAPSATANAVNFSIQGGPTIKVGDYAIPSNTWTWVDYQNGNLVSKNNISLTSGTKQITLTGIEPGVKIDRIIITTENCTPTGNGDNCSNLSSSPSISFKGITNNQTVAGSIAVEALPVNASNVSQVVFYIDDNLVKTEKIAPYCLGGDNSSGTACLGYDTSALANGSHVIRAVMMYGSGQTVQSSITVNVQNGTIATKQGDVNNDNKVDVLDLSILLSEWNRTGTGLRADINKDSKTDVLDLSTLLSNWGK